MTTLMLPFLAEKVFLDVLSLSRLAVNGSVIQQILPTFYVNRLQQQFSKYFSSLQIALADVDPPVYNISAITNSGSKIVAQVYV
ncbi:hypothetical protein KZG76_003832 [Salmonella enterica]|nr:hypothetical protein [Salmonella enterica]